MVSDVKNPLFRRSAEWKCVYFHWFRASCMRISLVLEGSVTNNPLYYAAANLECAYFQWFWAHRIPADRRYKVGGENRERL